MSQKSEKLGIMLGGGVIPVIRAKSADEALKVVEAIRKGGINTIEITMTVPGAIISQSFGDILTRLKQNFP